jgi:hypothetical protein
MTPPELKELRARLSAISAGLVELREIARGIHPAVLTLGGLDPRRGRSPDGRRSRSSLTCASDVECRSASRWPFSTLSLHFGARTVTGEAQPRNNA